jgi:hypothetical protein
MNLSGLKITPAWDDDPHTTHEKSDVEHYYRYDDYEYAKCTPYRVVRHTAKGVWIYLSWRHKDKFILNDARVRWAYPTKEEALNSYRMRKLRQIEWCRYWEKQARKGLSKVGFDADAEVKKFFEFEDDLL